MYFSIYADIMLNGHQEVTYVVVFPFQISFLTPDLFVGQKCSHSPFYGVTTTVNLL